MVVYNAVGCKNCFEVIESRFTHDYKTCGCGRVSVDGGLSYLRRSYVEPDDYYELSVHSEQPFEVVRLFAYWLFHGQKTLLCELTDEHLQAMLDQTPKYERRWRLLLEEKLYRAEM